MFSARSLRQRIAAHVVESAFAPVSLQGRIQSRGIHRTPMLDPHDATFMTQGIGQMMSPEGFDIAWTQNQKRLLAKLSALTDGTKYENSLTKHVLLETARNPDMASWFNYASMSHNTHMFFSTLSPTPTRPTDRFISELEASFSSIPSFRSTFLATANAMFGPGFVWLVQRTHQQVRLDDKYAILATYLAGSPYPAAHFRKQERDVATSSNNLAQGQSAGNWASQNGGNVGSGYASLGEFRGFGGNSHSKVAPGGQELTVLMCVSTWENTYLRDHGVDGKRKYLEAWWDSVDWAAVERNIVSDRGLGGLRMR